LPRSNRAALSVGARDPTRTIDDNEELVEQGGMTAEPSARVYLQKRPTAVASEAHASEVVRGDALKLLDLAPSSVDHIEYLHERILSRHVSAHLPAAPLA
jgi:hypothetical protein